MHKLLQIFAFAWAVITNRYEAGQRWSTGRSYLPGFVQDQRYDADPATREELVRKSRYFERNNAIANRLADLFEQYTVGPNGLQFIPASSNEGWNQANANAFNQWSMFCDLTSRQPFSTLQSLAARIWFFDGEVFLLKTYGEEISTERGRPTRRPRVQLIEGHRISTPPGRFVDEGKTIVEGIEVDRRGRPVAYWVRDGVEEATWTRRGADEVIHIFEPSRANQYRGLPMLYAVLNDLHDLDDLQMLTAGVAKKLASLTEAVENEAGEADPEQLRRERFPQRTQTSAGTETDETRTAYYKQHFGPRTVYMKRGDKLNRPEMNRPSIAEREYWDLLTGKICAGVGISKLLVFPYSVQGTVTRADLDVQNAFFRSRSAVLQAAFTQVYLWVTDWNIKNDENLFEKPADWRLVTTRPPRSVNVDVGRNSTALIAEYEAGWRTLEGICAEMGEDYRTVLRQRGREFKLALEIEKENGLPPGTLIQAVLEGLKQQAAKLAAEKAAEAAANPQEALAA